jgi:hypothetical protein
MLSPAAKPKAIVAATISVMKENPAGVTRLDKYHTKYEISIAVFSGKI